MINVLYFYVKGVLQWSESQFSEINVKLAKENEFVTLFVQKCLKMHKKIGKCSLKRVFGSARKSFRFQCLP